MTMRFDIEILALAEDLLHDKAKAAYEDNNWADYNSYVDASRALAVIQQRMTDEYD